jgi:cytidine deaminase
MNKIVMKQEVVSSFRYNEFNTSEELENGDTELVAAARTAALSAYAPYSGFRVGAAARLESGTIVCGANVENAAFPSGICAERSAVSNAVSNYRSDKIVAIAVSAITGGSETDEPVTPCGNCRQVIAEEESRNGNKVRVILSGKNKIYVIESVNDLLPLHFNNSNLKVILP